MSRGFLLIPNLGGEESGDWKRWLNAPAPAAMAKLWTLLFPRESSVVPARRKPSWPQAWSDLPSVPVFDWLDDAGGAFAWWPDEAAAAVARTHDARLCAPAPRILRHVHDKAFAQRVAEEEGLVPRSLCGLTEIFDPEALRDPAGALGRIRTCLAHWPPWTQQRFALKPRLGTSGRGRVAAHGSDFESNPIAGALPRLAERGGALLEPWLERTRDLSVQLHVAESGAVTLLGTLEQKLSPSGVYRGHRGVVDWRGRICAGSTHDETLVQAASKLARHAAGEGFFGPCGVDALCFTSDHPEETLRPVVEFNARFTAGTVALGLVRRTLPRLGLQPGDTRGFDFVLDAEAHPPEGQTLVLPLAEANAAIRPELRFV